MSLEPLAVVRRRLRAQGLAGPGWDSPAAAVAALGAVQAQEYAEMKWSLGERVRGAREDDVETALAAGEVVRTHVLRPTWHVVAADDLRWIVRLSAPRVHAANRRRYAELGLDSRTLARAHDVIARALAGGAALTRRELAAALARDGVSPEGQRLAYVLMHAELELLVCSGPRSGAQPTYALVDERVPAGRALAGDAARDELVRRYFTSHGPATVRDFAWWSGLPGRDADAALERMGSDLRREEDGDGRACWSSPDPPTAVSRTGALLVPTYDESTIAYRDLRIVVAAAPPREGLLTRPVVIDGRTVGGWARRLERGEIVLEVALLAELGVTARRALAAAVRRFGRFHGRPVRLAASVAR